MTAPSSNFDVTNEGKSKRSIVNEKLSTICSTNANKSKHSIIRETLSQNCSAEENDLRSTKEDKSECAIMKQKDAKNEVTYAVKKNLIDLTYLNAEEIFWTDLTCRIKERAWRSNQQSAIMHNLVPRNRLTP